MADTITVNDLGPAQDTRELNMELVGAALADGSLTSFMATTTLEKKNSMTLLRYEAHNLKGMLALTDGWTEQVPRAAKGEDDKRTDREKRWGFCDHFNYSIALEDSRLVRAQIEAKVGDPAKAIEKAAKVMVAALGWTLEKATTFVRAQRVEAGLAV